MLNDENLIALQRLSKQVETPLRKFSPAEVAEFERYEREKEAGNDPDEPLAYARWVRAGRPPGAKQPRLVFEVRPRAGRDFAGSRLLPGPR